LDLSYELWGKQRLNCDIWDAGVDQLLEWIDWHSMIPAFTQTNSSNLIVDEKKRVASILVFFQNKKAAIGCFCVSTFALSERGAYAMRLQWW